MTPTGQKVEKDFEAANSGIDLKLEQQPWANREEKVAAAFSGKKGPDVLLMIPDQIPQYVSERLARAGRRRGRAGQGQVPARPRSRA